MGGAQGRRGQAAGGLEPDAELGFQDDIFPWFHLVQWCAEDAKANRVFRWDLAGIQEAVAGLTQDVQAFHAKCSTELPPECMFSLDDSMAFGEWAEALLEWSASLRQVRYRLVPSRMREEVFWSRYFAGVRSTVRDQLFRGEAEGGCEGASEPTDGL
eukprot:CAMPEP_0204595274 /NCGR_PEP_ID=MMETSP0661-20131031/52576_1 /ASSEMBLY_ACC=CAM_ASM_000606 /TAXON_ID=109239 /ORGANISM="Alexandrium margalefi, Strain AMGDE01CS-322" /LENGTH=156 /DNA_ID=CAMNT_0051605777 /DNA_START=18 /DNA_END=488 /DNA_ORIENTATION=-